MFKGQRDTIGIWWTILHYYRLTVTSWAKQIIRTAINNKYCNKTINFNWNSMISRYIIIIIVTGYNTESWYVKKSLCTIWWLILYKHTICSDCKLWKKNIIWATWGCSIIMFLYMYCIKYEIHFYAIISIFEWNVTSIYNIIIPTQYYNVDNDFNNT